MFVARKPIQHTATAAAAAAALTLKREGQGRNRRGILHKSASTKMNGNTGNCLQTNDESRFDHFYLVFVVFRRVYVKRNLQRFIHHTFLFGFPADSFWRGRSFSVTIIFRRLNKLPTQCKYKIGERQLRKHALKLTGRDTKR